MALIETVAENSSDEETAGDSSVWGIVATPNLNTGALIGQATVHQSKFSIKMGHF